MVKIQRDTEQPDETTPKKIRKISAPDFEVRADRIDRFKRQAAERIKDMIETISRSRALKNMLITKDNYYKLPASVRFYNICNAIMDNLKHTGLDVFITRDIHTDYSEWNGQDLPFRYKITGIVYSEDEEQVFKCIEYHEIDRQLTRFFVIKMGFHHYREIPCLCRSMVQLKKFIKKSDGIEDDYIHRIYSCIKSFPNPSYNNNSETFVRESDDMFKKLMSNVNHPDTMLKSMEESVKKGLEAKTPEEKDEVLKEILAKSKDFHRDNTFLYNLERVRRYKEGFEQAGLSEQGVILNIVSCFSDK